MPDLTLILIGLLVIAILWIVIKFIFKLTIKIFSCGCLVILAVCAFLLISGYFNFS